MEEAEDLYGMEDTPDMYVAAAFDPGGDTGWCIVGIHPDAMLGDPEIKVLDNIEFWVAGEFTGPENDQVDEMAELISCWPSARLVIEDFILRKASMGRELLSPVRITAALEWAIRPRYFVKQSSEMAMTTMTDDRQQAMGLWIPGKEHARDATKHAFTYLKRQRERNAKAAAIAANGRR